MKRKVVIFALVCIILMGLFSVCVSANDGIIPKNQYLTDNGNLISDSDEQVISQALAEAESRCGTKIRAYTYRDFYSNYDEDDYISDSQETIDSLALLVIRYDYISEKYYYDLYTKGEPDTEISGKEADRILDNDAVYDAIKSGNLKDGIIAYASLTADAISGTLRPSFTKVLTVSLIIAFAVAVSVSLGVYFSYKKKLHSESYPLSRYASMDLKIQRDSFVTKFVTRVRIRTSNGGSGGRGRSGGGHRGGR